MTWNDLLTGVAAAYVPFPACDAVIVHVPVVSSVTEEPDTVQTDVVELEKLTGKALVADADSDTGP